MRKGGKTKKQAESPPAEERPSDHDAVVVGDDAVGLVARLSAFCQRAEEFLGQMVGRTPGWIRKVLVVLSLTAAAAIVFSHLLGGFPDAHDLPDHIAMATQFREGLLEGEIYPRWNGSFNYGLGEPTGVFYPPALPALAALVSLIPRIDVLTALYIVLFALTVIGMGGMYALTRRVAGWGTSIVACAVFALAPFRVFELYAAGLLSAYAAGCFIPWLIGALIDTSPVTRSSKRAVVTALRIGIVYAAITFFNLPCAVLTAYLVCLWVLVETVTTLSLRPLLTTVLGGTLGALLAAVYLLPAIVELPHIIVPHSGSEPLFRSNFVFQIEGSWMSAGLWSVFARMAGFQVALLLIGILAVIWRLYALYLARREMPEVASIWLRALTVFGLTSLFLMTPLSSWCWERLPALHRVNMPWRLLDNLAVPAAAVFAFVIGAFLAGSGQRRWIRLTAAGGVLVVTFSLFYSFQIAIASMNDRVQDSRPERLARNFYRRRGYFLPQGSAEPRSLRNRPLVEVRTPGSRVEIREWTNSRRRFRVTSSEPARLVLRTYHFPGWEASVETGGRPRQVTVGKDAETGQLTLVVPPGDSEVTVRFGLTLYRTLALATSVLAALVMAYVGWRHRHSDPEDDEAPEREVLSLIDEALESA